MRPQENTIDVGIPIDLPKLVDTRALIMAGSGGGKSYFLRSMVEAVGEKTQQIIIDPEGEFYTLREKFPFALVSKEGDIPLSLKYAETLAHKLLETNLSAIIDLYELQPDIRVLFVKRFLTALINAPKNLWHSCLVYIDEADKFCPEGARSESAQSVINLCAMGRKRGFGAVLCTQRIAKLNKDASAELMNKFIGRTGQDNDRKRAGDELGFNTKQDYISLRELEPGDFFTFGPAISNEIRKFTGKKVITTHLSSGKRTIAAPPTPMAIRKILDKLSSIPEEAEKEIVTKQQMTEEIKRLRAELARAKREQRPTDPAQLEKILSVSKKQIETSVKSECQEKISNLLQEMKAAQKKNLSYENSLRGIAKIISLSGNVQSESVTPIHKTGPAKPAPDMSKRADRIIGPTSRPTSYRENKSAVNPSDRWEESRVGDEHIPIGNKKILTACAQYPDGATREQLTTLTGYKRSTRDTYIKRLKEKNHIAQSGDRLVATPEGIAALGDSFEPLPTGEALQQYWLEALPLGEKTILLVLLTAYPDSVSRDVITQGTGYKRSTRDTYIKRMSSKEIIQVKGQGMVAASEDLFD